MISQRYNNEQLLERLRSVVGAGIVEIRDWPMTDWAGDEGIQFLVIVDDSESRKFLNGAVISKISESIQKQLLESGIETWPFVDFRTQSEQAALDAKAPGETSL